MMLPLDPEAVRLAELVTFVGTEGGPLIVMSESAVSSWRGADGPTDVPSDYDRACSGSFHVIEVGPRLALVLETPDNSAFVARPHGALIVTWVGADDAATLISAALAIPDDLFTEHVGELVHDGGGLLMFDSVLPGDSLEPDQTAAIVLDAGTYAFRVCTEWQVAVLGSDALPHDVTAQVLALRRS